MSEFLVVSSTFAREPLLALPLVFGLLVGLGALLLRLNTLAFGKPPRRDGAGQASYAPMYAHLALVLTAGIYCRRPWSHGSRMLPGCWDEGERHG